MNATELLSSQHREVEATFARIESASGSDDREPLVEELASLLSAHMTIEQEIFYPMCVNALQDEELIIKSYEEHSMAAFGLRRVLETDVDDDSFTARVMVLKELVEHHVKEEEAALFPAIERKLGAKKLQALGDSLLERYEEAQSEDYESFIDEAIGVTATSSRGGQRARTVRKNTRAATAPKSRSTRASGTGRSASKSAAASRSSASRSSGGKKKPAARSSSRR